MTRETQRVFLRKEIYAKEAISFYMSRRSVSDFGIGLSIASIGISILLRLFMPERWAVPFLAAIAILLIFLGAFITFFAARSGDAVASKDVNALNQEGR